MNLTAEQIGGLVVLALFAFFSWWHYVPSRCPACGSRMNVAARAGRRRAFECRGCGEIWIRKPGGPLIPRERWEDGMRDEPPKAKIVKR